VAYLLTSLLKSHVGKENVDNVRKGSDILYFWMCFSVVKKDYDDLFPLVDTASVMKSKL
jgi:hypothetical protein